MKTLSLLVAVLFLAIPAFSTPLTVSDMKAQVIPLGITQDVEVTVTIGQDFKGTSVRLDVDRSQLDAVDKDKDVAVSLKENVFPVKPGQTVKAMLKISVSPLSPDFDKSGVEIVARGNDNTVSKNTVELSVPAVLEIRLAQGHIWSVPRDDKGNTNVRHHNKGILVRFVNYDTTETHLIHGQGAIPHGTRDLNVATNSAPGGAYEVQIDDQQKNLRGLYYCHDHENFGLAKTVTFNMK